MKTEIINIPTRDNRSLSGYFVLPDHRYDADGNLIGYFHETIILLLHDLPGMKRGVADMFLDLQSALARKGFRSLAFDFSGFGESTERPRHFDKEQICEDIEDVRQWLKDTTRSEKIAIIAEGLSAKIALDVCDENVKAFVALYPIWDTPDNFTIQGVDFDTYKPVVTNEEIERLAQSMVEALPETPSKLNMRIPVKIHLGSDDARVSISQADWAKERIEASRMEVTVYEKGTHGLPEASIRKMLLYHTAEFLSKLA